jgi:polyhydroxyalkanoate synthesis regulator phasin
MKLIDDYVDEYMDRNMEYLIEEWGLATQRDAVDFRKRTKALEQEIHPLGEFETSASERLSQLENRLKKIKEERL